eukprot:m.858893 g.858893  ORF g.858893 m.858893 type:complete len:387 (-) comp23525_c0_seq9:1988-3148(-)
MLHRSVISFQKVFLRSNMRGFFTTLVLGCIHGTSSFSVQNCTQLKLSSPGYRVAVSVNNTYALFAMDEPYDAVDAGGVEIYDRIHHKWSTGRLSGGRTNIAVTSWQHLAIFAGGGPHRDMPKSKAVDVWNSITNTWTFHNMTIGRDLLAAVSCGKYTLFAGGSAPQVNQSETMEVDVWDHSTDTWTQAKLSQARKKPQGVCAGGKILIAGGEIAKKPPTKGRLGDYTAVVDIFDTVTGQWSTTELLQAMQYFGSTHATPDVAVFGGGFYDDIRLGEVQLFNTKTKMWSLAENLSHNRSNLDATNLMDRFAVFGSGNIDSDAKTAFDFYDGVTDTWVASHGHTAGNPTVTGLQNLALFAYPDGVIDVLEVVTSDQDQTSSACEELKD